MAGQDDRAAQNSCHQPEYGHQHSDEADPLILGRIENVLEASRNEQWRNKEEGKEEKVEEHLHEAVVFVLGRGYYIIYFDIVHELIV